jgi:hypothetical protein
MCENYVTSSAASLSYRSCMWCILGGLSVTPQAHRDEIHETATEQPPGATGRAPPASGPGGLPGGFV